jgi:hypothetical protein
MRIIDLDGDEGALIVLSAQECEIIADGCMDGSSPGIMSISGDLSAAFSAMAQLLPWMAKSTEGHKA